MSEDTNSVRNISEVHNGTGEIQEVHFSKLP